MFHDLHLPGYSPSGLLYRGEHSRVIAATRLSDGAQVAIKLLGSGETSGDRGGEQERATFARAQRELELTERSAGPGIVRAQGLEHAGAEAALILERVVGTTLRAQISEGGCSLSAFLSIARPLTAAVARMHRARVIHRDVKPDNILLDVSGSPVLCDFGIAVQLPRGEDSIREPEVLQGSLHYLAPEQTGRMNRGVDTRTDLYALGATFFEMLAGRQPFAGLEGLDLIHAHLATEPPGLGTLRSDLPSSIGKVVARLLAKDPAQRYQSARGLLFDLDRVAADPEGAWALGESDVLDHIVFPAEPHGRRRELDRLEESITSAANGTASLALVAGKPGVGKTTLLAATRPVAQRLQARAGFGRFAAHRQNEPYSAVRDALAEICLQLLAENEEALEAARHRITSALGGIAAVVTELVPELERVIGKPAAVAEIGPTETRNRFRLAMRRLMSALGTSGCPVVLVLDDLHLADRASLALIESLLAQPAGLPMAIVAAGDIVVLGNESFAALPALARTAMGGALVELQPLSDDDLESWIAGLLHRPVAEVSALAAVVAQRSGRIPFFARQFLRHLEEIGALALAEDGRFAWDEAAVAAAHVPDDLVGLMRATLQRVGGEARLAAALAAQIGGPFPAELLLHLAHGRQTDGHAAIDVHGALACLNDAGILARSGTAYQFAHPTLEEESALGLPEPERRLAHRRIGWWLLGNQSAAELPAGRLFAVADHLSWGLDRAAGDSSPDNGARFSATLRLAGERALRATSYDAAIRFFRASAGVITAETWITAPDDCFATELGLAKALFLGGQTQAAEVVFGCLADRPLPPRRYAEAISARVSLLTVAGSMAQAIEVGLEGLEHIGRKVTRRPSRIGLVLRLLTVLFLLRRRRDDEILARPRAQGPLGDQLDAVSTLVDAVGPAAYWSNAQLYAGMHLAHLRDNLLRGHSGGIAYSFARQAMLTVGLLKNFGLAARLARLAVALEGKIPSPRHAARIRTLMAMTVESWNQPFRAVAAGLVAAERGCEEAGDLEYANYSTSFRVGLLFASGHNLRGLREEVVTAAQRCTAWGYKEVASVEHQSLELLDVLTGERAFDPSPSFGKSQLLWRETKAPIYVGATRALPVLYLLGAPEACFDHAEESADFGKALPGNPLSVEHQFWHALAAAACAGVPGPRQSVARRRFVRLRKVLRKQAQLCPANNLTRITLLDAEAARLAGDDEAACAHYGRAVDHAAAGEQTHLEALAYELHGRLLLQKNPGSSQARLQLREADTRYRIWGARAKGQALEAEFSWLVAAGQTLTAVSSPLLGGARGATVQSPRLATGQRPAQPTGAVSSQTLHPITASGDPSSRALDLVTMLGVTQAISEEVTTDGVLRQLMAAAITNAGAQRGLLILRGEGDTHLVQAESTAQGRFDKVNRPLGSFPAAPQALLRLCLRGGEPIVIGDASTHESYARDPHVEREHVRSMLAAPIVRQGNVIGAVYLENNAVSDVFTPARVELLRVLATQAAISLENAQLYANLESKVTQRTRELDARNQQMRLVLDNVDQGFVTIDRQAVMTEERSAIVGKWFGSSPPGSTFADYLAGIDGKAGALFRIGWDAIVEDIMPFELTLEQLPRRFTWQDRVFGLAFRPIVDSARQDPASFARMLVVISDMTAELARQRARQAAQELAEIHRRVVADRLGVLEFREEATELLTTISFQPAPPLPRLARALHTLKGNAGMMGLGSLVELCHGLETEIDEIGEAPARDRIEQLRKVWSEIDSMLGALLGARPAGSLEVSADDATRLVAAIQRGDSADVLCAMVESWWREPVAQRLARLGHEARRLAASGGKGAIHLVIEAADVRLDGEAWAPFFAALVHVVRNAVDHGFESPQERQAAGKAGPATLRLSVRLDAANLLVEVADDGRGVAWERIAARARKAGLPAETHEHLVAALFADGITTRDAVTEISGRGIGAGAARAECEVRGGHVEVTSEPGRGTAFRFVFPAVEATRRGRAEPSTPAPIVAPMPALG